MLKMKQDKEKKEKEGVRVINGKYQIEKKIGEGVSSTVFSAINIHTGEKVAIKKIKNFLENKYESLRILREILLLRKLKHPNIINLREIVIEDDRGKELSLILDYLPTDAKKLFKSNSIFDYLKIKLIIFQILLGLNYCQQSQVLHRDLKPENILITEDMTQVKLCDFGLARAVYLEGKE
jgi:serine/threonine protein kinase